jgi:hypothetical protein
VWPRPAGTTKGDVAPPDFLRAALTEGNHVRLSSRKAACSSMAPPSSTGNPGSVYTNCETAGATFIVAAVIVPGMTGIVGYSAVTESVRVGGDSPGAGGFCPTLDSSLGDFGSNQPRNNGSTPELLFYSSSRFSSSIPIGMRGTLSLLFSNRRKKWAKRPIFGRVLWH